MLFSVGGAIDAPEKHQQAIDNMLKQLVLGGMPLDIANDIFKSNDTTIALRVPKAWRGERGTCQGVRLQSQQQLRNKHSNRFWIKSKR